MRRTVRPSFVFVYNANSGLFNTVADIAHKVLSPETYSCNLCALTHGHFRVREEWTDFLENFDAEVEFLHRDEFSRTYTGTDIALPAVLEKSSDGLSLAIDAATLQRCESLDALKQLLLTHRADAAD